MPASSVATAVMTFPAPGFCASYDWEPGEVTALLLKSGIRLRATIRACPNDDVGPVWECTNPEGNPGQVVIVLDSEVVAVECRVEDE